MFKVPPVVNNVGTRLDIPSIRLTVVLRFFEFPSVLVSRTLLVRSDLGGELFERVKVDGRQRHKVGRFPWVPWDFETVLVCELEHLLARHQQVRSARWEDSCQCQWHE